MMSGLKLLHGTVYCSLVCCRYSAWSHYPGQSWCHEAPPEVLVPTYGLPGRDDKVHAGPETAGDIWTQEEPQSIRWWQTERVQPAGSCCKERFIQSQSRKKLFVWRHVKNRSSSKSLLFSCSSRWTNEPGGTDSGCPPRPGVSRKRMQRRTRTTRVSQKGSWPLALTCCRWNTPHNSSASGRQWLHGDGEELRPGGDEGPDWQPGQPQPGQRVLLGLWQLRIQPGPSPEWWGLSLMARQKQDALIIVLIHLSYCCFSVLYLFSPSLTSTRFGLF